ncbi:MAG: tetratricopeptide repeat protein [Pirellulales bacterium]
MAKSSAWVIGEAMIGQPDGQTNGQAKLSTNRQHDGIKPSDQPRRKLSSRKKFLFSALILVAFFAILEGGLYLLGIQLVVVTQDPFVGFESSLRLFVEHAGVQDQTTLITAEAKRAYFNEQKFLQQKPKGTYRIFCIGGSTVYGRPYDDTTSFPGWWRELLPVADPTCNWEVINTGGVSYASYRVAALMEELVEYQPDLFVIYSGHNEFLEERTYREIKDLSPALRRVSSLLSRTRTHSLVRSIMKPFEWKPGRHQMSGEVNALLDHTVGPSDYHRNDHLRQKILKHFQLNLVRMIEIAQRAGAEVLLVVPASNVKDSAPFKSQHRDGLSAEQQAQWLHLFDRGKLLQATSKYDEALKAYQQAEEIDDRFAELHYQKGRLLLAMRRLTEARTTLDRALVEDICPLRAAPKIQEMVRQTSVTLSIPMVDAEELLKSECLRRYGHHSPGREYFLDHVHPTVETNQLLAKTIVERLIDAGRVEQHSSWNQGAIEKVAERIEAKIDTEGQAVALRNLAKVLNWSGKHEEGGLLALQAVDLRSRCQLAEDPEAYVLAAAHLKVLGDIDTAIDYYQRALQHRPNYVEAHRLLGAAMVERGRFEEAKGHFQNVARLIPDDAHAHHMVGAVLAELDHYQEAIPHYQRAHRLTPNDAHIHYNMAYALEQLGNTEGAIRWYQTTLQLNPKDTEAQRNLERLNSGKLSPVSRPTSGN